MPVLTASAIIGLGCDAVRALFFDRTLPAGFTWPRPNATPAQGVAALRQVLAGIGGNSAAANPVQALVDAAGMSGGTGIASMIEAGATGPVALAAYKRVTSNTAHGPGDCHQTPANMVTEPITEGVGAAVAQAGKIALTLVFVLGGLAMILLGLRQLAAPAIDRAAPVVAAVATKGKG